MFWKSGRVHVVVKVDKVVVAVEFTGLCSLEARCAVCSVSELFVSALVADGLKVEVAVT